MVSEFGLEALLPSHFVYLIHLLTKLQPFCLLNLLIAKLLQLVGTFPFFLYKIWNFYSSIHALFKQLRVCTLYCALTEPGFARSGCPGSAKTPLHIQSIFIRNDTCHTVLKSVTWCNFRPLYPSPLGCVHTKSMPPMSKQEAMENFVGQNTP